MSRKTVICGLALALCVQLLLNGCESDGPTGGSGGSDFSDSLAFEIQIDKTHNPVQGTHEIVDVSLNVGPYQLTELDLKIVFDAEGLYFQSATPGELFTACGWEYFDYQFSVIPSYLGGGPVGLVHVRAVAHHTLGLPRMSEIACQNELTAGGRAVLFSLDFIVSEDRTLECQYIPIRFYWEDCDDNVLSFRSHGGLGEEVRSETKRIIDFDLIGDISADSIGFPTYQGYQRECFPADRASGSPPVRMLDLLNGGVDFVCADGVGVWGDVNLDGEFNIADVVMLVDFFTVGVEVFAIDPVRQIAATDMNGDGRTLTVSDLVYVRLMLWGSGRPYFILDGGSAECSIVDGVASVDRDVAAAVIVIEGDATWTPLTENTRFASRFEDGRTHVLIMGKQDSRIVPSSSYTFTGPFLETDATIRSIDMSTVDGARVDVTIVEE